MTCKPGNRFATRVVACAASVLTCMPWGASAQPAGVDPKADAVLKSMTTYLSAQKQFSAVTENSLELVTTAGQKIQFSSPVTVTVVRPNKLHAERRGDIVDQSFYYDGKSLTLLNPGTKQYATVAAPPTLDAMFDFARTTLDLVVPGADLIDTRNYERLMDGVTSGVYVGMAVLGGQRCHHIAYRGAVVDWQLWVREGNRPLPCRYVITSKDVAGSPQFTIQIVKWDGAPKVAASRFTFIPAPGSRAIEFLPVGAR
jgi:hypothetical protein